MDRGDPGGRVAARADRGPGPGRRSRRRSRTRRVAALGRVGQRFTFVVTYTDPAGRRPDSIVVRIGGVHAPDAPLERARRAAGVTFRWAGELPKGEHAVVFEARSRGRPGPLARRRERARRVRPADADARPDPEAQAEAERRRPSRSRPRGRRPGPRRSPTPRDRPRRPEARRLRRRNRRRRRSSWSSSRAPSPTTRHPPDRRSMRRRRPARAIPSTAVVPGDRRAAARAAPVATRSADPEPAGPAAGGRCRRPDVGPARQPDRRPRASARPTMPVLPLMPTLVTRRAWRPRRWPSACSGAVAATRSSPRPTR